MRGWSAGEHGRFPRPPAGRPEGHPTRDQPGSVGGLRHTSGSRRALSGRPEASASTNLRTRSGWAAARRRQTCPPMEWPQTSARGTPRSCIQDSGQSTAREREAVLGPAAAEAAEVRRIDAAQFHQGPHVAAPPATRRAVAMEQDKRRPVTARSGASADLSQARAGPRI